MAYNVQAATGKLEVNRAMSSKFLRQFLILSRVEESFSVMQGLTMLPPTLYFLRKLLENFHENKGINKKM